MYVEPPLIPLGTSKNDDKMEKYCVNIKLRRDTMSQKSDLYEFKMTSFYNSYPEEFLLFIRYFNINIEASGTGSITNNLKVKIDFTLPELSGGK